MYFLEIGLRQHPGQTESKFIRYCIICVSKEYVRVYERFIEENDCDRSGIYDYRIRDEKKVIVSRGDIDESFKES